MNFSLIFQKHNHPTIHCFNNSTLQIRKINAKISNFKNPNFLFSHNSFIPKFSNKKLELHRQFQTLKTKTKFPSQRIKKWTSNSSANSNSTSSSNSSQENQTNQITPRDQISPTDQANRTTRNVSTDQTDQINQTNPINQITPHDQITPTDQTNRTTRNVSTNQTDTFDSKFSNSVPNSAIFDSNPETEQITKIDSNFSQISGELPPKPPKFRFQSRYLRFVLLRAEMSRNAERILQSELLRRIIMTVFLLCASRIGYFIPLPGFDRKIIPTDLFGMEMDVGDVGDLKMSLFTLGIMPHILSSSFVQAIIQLNLFPSFSKLRENYGGQERLKKIIWKGTIATSLIMGFATALYYRSYSISYYANKFSYIFIITLLLTIGALIMDRISESFETVGFGQGASVLICVNIITSYAESLGSLFSSISKGAISTPGSFLVLFLSFCFLTSMAAVLGSGIRKVYIDYFEFEFFDKPRLNPNPNSNEPNIPNQNSNSSPLSISPYIPFYINPSGMTPILYSSCILTFMFFIFSIIPGCQGMAKIFSANSTGLAGILHQMIFFFLIIRLNIGDSDDSVKRICESLNKMGAYVPGLKNGSHTLNELSNICFSSRLHGGMMLASLTLFSSIIDHKLRSSFSGISIGFTSLLIIVGSIISLRRTFEAYQQMPKLKLVLEKYSQY